MPSMQELVTAVKRHALLHFEDDPSGGWDRIVEAWTDEEIAGWLAGEGIEDVGQAIQLFAEILGTQAEHEADIQKEAF